jgi:hypothetical protein
LASGIITYTNDVRFTVQHTPQTEMWNLVIDKTVLEDNGTYECQVLYPSTSYFHCLASHARFYRFVCVKKEL